MGKETGSFPELRHTLETSTAWAWARGSEVSIVTPFHSHLRGRTVVCFTEKETNTQGSRRWPKTPQLTRAEGRSQACLDSQAHPLPTARCPRFLGVPHFRGWSGVLFFRETPNLSFLHQLNFIQSPRILCSMCPCDFRASLGQWWTSEDGLAPLSSAWGLPCAISHGMCILTFWPYPQGSCTPHCGPLGACPVTQFSSVAQSCPILCDPMDCKHTRPPRPSPTPGVYSNSCPLSRWCHPTISSSVIPFSSSISSSCLQSFPASGSFPMSPLFTSSGQSIGVSASASVLPMNIQVLFPLGLIGLISLQSKELSRVFSNNTVQKHQFFSTQLSLWSNSHTCTGLLEKL